VERGKRSIRRHRVRGELLLWCEESSAPAVGWLTQPIRLLEFACQTPWVA